MAKILPIVTVPNPILRQLSKPVEMVDKKITQFITDLVETLVKKENPSGVGLSAVQVGKLWRIFVLNIPPVYDLKSMDGHLPPSEIKVFINPEIIDESEELSLGPNPKEPVPEGCLSVPALYGPVPRHVWVKVKYQTIKYEVRGTRYSALRNNLDDLNSNQNRKPKTENLIEKIDTFANFYARVVQHEYDHLEGILFTDYTLKTKQELYFDQADRLVKITQPEKLITW